MPNRIIKESARTSETLDNLSDGAERLFWRLITVADDFGRFEASASVLKALCFPRRVDCLKTVQVKKWFSELEACNLVQSYDCNGKHLAFFTTWEKHQQKRAKASKFPEPTPDSIRNHLQSNVSEIEIENRDTRSDLSSTDNGSTPESVSVKDFVESWNNSFEGKLSKVTLPLSDKRSKKVALRLRDHPEIQFWEQVFTNISTSDFLLGIERDWRCSMDWLTENDTNCLKVYEGTYNRTDNGND